MTPGLRTRKQALDQWISRVERSFVVAKLPQFITLGELEFTDSAATNQPASFYRVKSQ